MVSSRRCAATCVGLTRHLMVLASPASQTGFCTFSSLDGVCGLVDGGAAALCYNGAVPGGGPARPRAPTDGLCLTRHGTAGHRSNAPAGPQRL
jgi:hypothetical protein